MTEIEHKDPEPRKGDTPIGKLMGYLNEYSTYLKYESIAEGIRATWVLDFWPLSLIEDALVGIVQWAYDNVYQNAYNYGADKGNQMNNQIMGWIEDLRQQALARIATLDGMIKDAEQWLSNHEKRIKELEKKMGLPVQIPEILRSEF